MVAVVDNNLAARGHLHSASEHIAVGLKSYLQEHAIERHMAFLLCLEIAHVDARQLGSIARQPDSLTAHDDVDIGHAPQFLLQHVVGLHLVGKLKHRDVTADSRQVDSCFHSTVATADDSHILSFIERSVAVRTEMDAMADILILVGQSQASPTCARSYNHLGSKIGLATACLHALHGS